ncbi:MAG TPA: hypothetical protein VFE88_01180 [Candidatus Nanoarchaeia archaeon]|nr:hypothetical protein [Candidatus Nanoarchaeia archaeon]
MAKYDIERIIKMAEALKSVDETRIAVLPERTLDGLENGEARKEILEIGEELGCEPTYVTQALELLYPTKEQIRDLERRFSCEEVKDRQTVINRTFTKNVERVRMFLRDLHERLNPIDIEMAELTPGLWHKITSPISLSNPYRREGKLKRRSFEELVNDETSFSTPWDFSLKEPPSDEGKYDSESCDGQYYRPKGLIVGLVEPKEIGPFRRIKNRYACLEIVVNGLVFPRRSREGMGLISKPSVLAKIAKPEILSLLGLTLDEHKEEVESKIRLYY